MGSIYLEELSAVGAVRFPDIPLYQGFGAPMRLEADLKDCEVTYGAVPKDLNGILYRCGPVSAAVIAVDIVSQSRISPTMMTSGSCRITLRRASGKDTVSVPISRCETEAMLSWKRYSIGSSIVTMWTGWRSVMSLTIAASVVDLPDPVGPVTRTRPAGRSANVSITSGRFRAATCGIW